MCGFAGWTGVQDREGGTVPLLRAMGQALSARGPDEETRLERDDFRVVFRRLAINDIAGGRQPFSAADGRYIAVVNGEIYNHRALYQRYLPDVTPASRSDCEVVIHLFRRMGPRCLEKLNGIYSIAIWDDLEQKLLLARDRLGVKPLYYCTTVGNRLLFASELKALLVHPDAPRTMDWSAFQGVPSSSFPFERPLGRKVATGVQGVLFVEPATYVEWHDGRLRPPERYWDPAGPGDGAESPDECVDRYVDLVTDSVRMQLMSDVPVGLFLSGGLDSALIGAIASRFAPGLEAFTLVEPSITRTGDTEAATHVARALGIKLHLVRVDEDALRATMNLDLRALEYFVWIMDSPLFDVELLFKHELHRYAKSERPQMKVILLGQGADEFAGGYSRLAGDNWSAFADSEARAFHASLLRDAGVPAAYSRYVNASLSEPLARARARQHEPWQLVRFGDLAAYNLWHEDRTASANGMEVRVPFLDHRLVELLCSIPASLRRELFFDKAIERRAALRFLPAALAHRPKVPLFGTRAGADDSVSALRRRFVLGAFDEYRQAYLEPADALFSLREMTALRDQAAAPSTGESAVHLLCRCMTISIFARICRELRHPTFEPPCLTTKAPPLTATSLPAPGPPELTSSSRIVLSESVRLALSCEDEPALFVIRDGALVARIALPTTWDMVGSQRGAFSGRHLALAGLARAFGVEVEAMRSFAEAFVECGWGTLIAASG